MAKQTILDRIDAQGDAASINADKELSTELKAAARRHKMTAHMEKSRGLESAIKEAETTLVASLPPLEQPTTAGGAQVDAELRANFRALSEDKQEVLLKSSPATRLALARSPRELTGLGELHHNRIVDEVRRATYPDEMAKFDADRAVIEAAKQVQGAHRETVRSLFGLAIETHVMKIA
ncbi:hypothetical protein [Bradyrhizobium jicamae]|nr:hypothetical protein [Bradyrhizobium jicamae]